MKWRGEARILFRLFIFSKYGAASWHHLKARNRKRRKAKSRSATKAAQKTAASAESGWRSCRRISSLCARAAQRRRRSARRKENGGIGET